MWRKDSALANRDKQIWLGKSAQGGREKNLMNWMLSAKFVDYILPIKSQKASKILGDGNISLLVSFYMVSAIQSCWELGSMQV